eukprot:g24269.t1
MIKRVKVGSLGTRLERWGIYALRAARKLLKKNSRLDGQLERFTDSSGSSSSCSADPEFSGASLIAWKLHLAVRFFSYWASSILSPLMGPAPENEPQKTQMTPKARPNLGQHHLLPCDEIPHSDPSEALPTT